MTLSLSTTELYLEIVRLIYVLFNNPSRNSQGSNGTLDATSISTLSQVGLCTETAGILTMPATVTINGVPFVHDGVISGNQSLDS